MNVLAATVFFVEVFLLAFAEKRIWKSVITPLNCLMLPYAAIVLLCICLSGRMDYPSFNFSTLWVYVVGLLLFFIPSCLFGFLYNRRKNHPAPATPLVSLPETSILKALEWLTVPVLVLFLAWFLWLASTSPAKIGSNAFGEQFAAYGFFGHLFNFLMVLGIVWVFLFDFKEYRRYGAYILAILFFMLIYQVKSWLFIPVLGALCLRILAGKTRLTWKMVLVATVAAFCIFFVFYWVDMYMAGAEKYTEVYHMTKGDYARATASYINKHFLSYLTAGVYGFSQDMTLGILEECNPEKIFTPFVNVVRFLKGEPLASQINPYFLDFAGGESTNVRSFMGSLYVFLGRGGAVGFMLMYSLLVNAVFYWAGCSRNFFLGIYVAWILGRLAMGWFEIYVQHLNVVEIPLVIACLFLYTQCWKKWIR